MAMALDTQHPCKRYFIFFCVLVFALYEHKNQNTDTMGSTMLPQARKREINQAVK
jgi:hypothetical protein